MLLCMYRNPSLAPKDTAREYTPCLLEDRTLVSKGHSYSREEMNRTSARTPASKGRHSRDLKASELPGSATTAAKKRIVRTKPFPSQQAKPQLGVWGGVGMMKTA